MLVVKRVNYTPTEPNRILGTCELGRLDILMPISLMSHYLASAREGHLDQLFHVFAYLKNHDRATMVFEDLYPTFGDVKFSECDWTKLYPDACEPIMPENMPVPRGKHVVMSCFVDADHAPKMLHPDQ